MTDECKPRPQKRVENFTDSYTRLQALLLAHGAGRRDIDGRPRLNYSHPDVQRCVVWMERVTGITPQSTATPPLPVKNGCPKYWQTLKRNLPPGAMARLVERIEQHYNVKPYDSSATPTPIPSGELLDQMEFLESVDFYT